MERPFHVPQRFETYTIFSLVAMALAFAFVVVRWLAFPARAAVVRWLKDRFVPAESGFGG
jgi:hypothetical protein